MTAKYDSARVRAKLIFTLCYQCLGCQRLEDPHFEGEKKCKDYNSYKTSEDLSKQGGKSNA